jgi:penicillin-binding protein 2
MLVFDQLRKNDAQLQLLALLLCGGFVVLGAGLWWVQIVNANRYRASVETQSFRSVRIPAVRGKILDRNGVALAENRPNYSISLYLEELSSAFRKAYRAARPRAVVTNDLPFWKDWLGFSTVRTQYLHLSQEQTTQIVRATRYRVVLDVANEIAAILQVPLPLDYNNFTRHYETARAIPFSLANNLSPQLVARFEEQSLDAGGVDLEIQSRRFYPYSNTAAHVIGYVHSDDSSAAGEDAFFSYRLPDYRGLVGIEGGLDQALRGRAGAKSVQVNNLGYRQTESIWEEAEPGQNVVLTLDLDVQQAAEAALRSHITADGHGAIVVMDVRSGDILALASSPSSDPNAFIRRFTPAELARWKDNSLGVQKNRATAEQYQAGSVFKTMVALAALENGLDTKRLFDVDPNPRNPNKGIVYVGRGRHPFRDTAQPGKYDLRRAIARSSNSYFIQVGALPNVFERVVELGRRLHLGERIGLPLLQETAGHFPRTGGEQNWNPVFKANICIGQGEMDVTPMQIAVMISAIANGGTVLMPRLVDRLEPQDPARLEAPTVFPRGQVRDHLGVSKRSLDILHDAMLAETEDQQEGTGRAVQGCGFRVCGKTGTAELSTLREDGGKKNTTWFGSFAPYETPRYAVIVMVENGQSGGGTCAPIAHDVYVALKAYEARSTSKTQAVATR